MSGVHILSLSAVGDLVSYSVDLHCERALHSILVACRERAMACGCKSRGKRYFATTTAIMFIEDNHSPGMGTEWSNAGCCVTLTKLPVESGFGIDLNCSDRGLA